MQAIVLHILTALSSAKERLPTSAVPKMTFNFELAMDYAYATHRPRGISHLTRYLNSAELTGASSISELLPISMVPKMTFNFELDILQRGS